MHRALVFFALFVGIALMTAPPSSAQVNAEINARIQFNFSPPGARSLGFGGAFLGLADDATTAYTNPAGLTSLSLPEVSIEGRSWKYTTEYADHGNASGTATGGANCQNGVGDCIDGVVMGESEKTTSGLAFLSVVYPRNNWAIAVYRQEVANFRAAFSDQGIYFDTLSPQTNPGRYFPISADIDINVVNYGLSAALRLSEQFSLGLGASYYQFKIDSTTTRYGFSVCENQFLEGCRFGPPKHAESNVRNFVVQDGSDSAWGVNLGLLWKPSDKISVGAVYRQGPKFTYSSTTTRVNPPLEPTNLAPTWDLPDVYGVGAAYRPAEHVTVTFDYDRVLYSQLADNMMDTSGDPLIDPQNYVVDDANEFHLGFEYVFLTSSVAIPVRVGAWTDPDHTIRYEGQYQQQKAYFTGGSDEMHYTGGFGIAIGRKFQIDAAYDYSRLVKTGSLSAVIRFE